MSQEARAPHRALRTTLAGPSQFTVRARATIARSVRRPVAVVRTTVRLYMSDNCSTYAAAIAYYALFSLIPLTLVTISVFGLLLSVNRMETFIFDQLPIEDSATTRDNVHKVLERAREASGAGIGVGLVVLAWSASGVFTAVRRGLSATRHRPMRPYWHGKLLDLALVPALGLLILAFVALMAALQIVIDEVGNIGPLEIASNHALRFTSAVLTAALSFVAFIVLYRFVPTSRPAWREAAVAAFGATVLFEALRNAYGIVLSLTPFSRETALYAGFGTALTFLLWMFLNATILLLGAEFGRAVFGSRRDETADATPSPS